MQPEKPGFEIEVPESIASGIYANGISICATAYEVSLDFGHPVPERGVFRVESRIILSPQRAKLLAQMLQRYVDQYEGPFGAIIASGRG